MTLLQRRLAATLVLGAGVLLAPAPAGAEADDPPCAAETATHDQAAAARDTVRQSYLDHVADVYRPALAARRQANADRDSWKPLVPPAREAFHAARDAYRADPTPEARETRDAARAELDLAVSNVAETRDAAASAAQAVATAAAERAGLRAVLDDAQALNTTTLQALQLCLDAHPVAGTMGAVTTMEVFGYITQVADLTFGPLYSRAGSRPSYRVVPVATCGGISAPDGCYLGSAAAGADGVLRLLSNPFAFCGTSSDTFDIYREDTATLVASVPMTWTAAC